MDLYHFIITKMDAIRGYKSKQTSYLLCLWLCLYLAQALPTCDVGFPRLIGYSGKDTYPVTLDYFPGVIVSPATTPTPGTDKIAVTGYVDNYNANDQLFIAVYGGSQMTLEWNQIILVNQQGSGIAFSTDGLILAVYCSQVTSQSPSLVVFQVSTGAILNYFKYNNMENDVELGMRLLLLGTSPVNPSRYNIYGYYGVTTAGSYLFAFEINPGTPGTATQVFARKSNEVNNSERRFGLLLSSDQTRLYVYGTNFGKFVLGSALAATGMPLWALTYEPGNLIWLFNVKFVGFEKFTENNVDTLMAVMGDTDDELYVARVEQDLAVNTCCATSKIIYGIFTGAINGITMKALFVESRDIIVMLLAWNSEKLILARSNFKTLELHQWNILRQLNMNNLYMGRFISPEVFYVPHHDTQVSVDQWTSSLTTRSFTKIQSIFYTTDSQLTCFEENRSFKQTLSYFTPNVPILPSALSLHLTSADSILVNLPLPGAVSIPFPLPLSEIDSACGVRSPYRIYPDPMPEKWYIAIATDTKQVFMSVLQVCDPPIGSTFTNTLTYSAMDIDEFALTGTLPYLMDSSGLITITTVAANAVNYSFKVKAQLADGTFHIQTIFLFPDNNDPPYFPAGSLPLPVIEVHLNLPFDYKLSVEDPQGHKITASLIGNPSFVTAQGIYVKFNPVMLSQVGYYSSMMVQVQDQYGKAQTQKPILQFKVRNDPPKFASEPEDLRIYVNGIKRYKIPATSDKELLAVTCVTKSMPYFSEFDQSTCEYTFSPQFQAGIFEVSGYITDGGNSTSFSFQVTVLNRQPIVVQPKIQIVEVKSKHELKLSVTDPDYQQVVFLTARMTTGANLPSFIKFDDIASTFEVEAQRSSQVGLYKVEVSYTDNVVDLSQTPLEPTVHKVIIQFQVMLNIQPNDTLQDTPANASETAQDYGNFTLMLGKVIIERVKRDQQAVIKVLPPKYAGLIMRNLTNQSMRLEMATQDNQRVNFTIRAKNTAKGEINVDLFFEDPNAISAGPVPDIMRVVILHNMTFFPKDAKRMIIFLKEFQNSTRQIPPQISKKLRGFANIFDDGRLGVSVSISGNYIMLAYTSVIQHRSLWIQLLFLFLKDISFLTINTLISMPVPGIAQICQKVLLNLLYVDILMTEKWLPQIFENVDESTEEDQPLNDYFYANGFESRMLIKTLGSSFVFIQVYFWLIAIYGILIVTSFFCIKLIVIRERLHKFLFWNFSITLMFSQFPPLTIAVMINIYQLTLSSSAIQNGSTIFCYIASTLVCIVFAGSWVALVKNRDKVQSPEFEAQFSKLTEGLNTKSRIGVYWNLIILCRWIFTNFIMVYLRDYGQLQILTLLLFSIAAQRLILSGRPQENKLDNQIDLFIEVCVSLYLYVLLILTDWWGTNDFRDEFGWILVGLIIISLIANLLHFFISIRLPLKRFIAKIKAILIKFKPRSAAKYLRQNKGLPDKDFDQINHSSKRPTHKHADSSNYLLSQNPNQNKKQSWGNMDIRRAYNMLAVQGNYKAKLFYQEADMVSSVNNQKKIVFEQQSHDGQQSIMRRQQVLEDLSPINRESLRNQKMPQTKKMMMAVNSNAYLKAQALSQKQQKSFNEVLNDSIRGI